MIKIKIMIHIILNNPDNYGDMPLTGFDINEIEIKKIFISIQYKSNR